MALIDSYGTAEIPDLDDDPLGYILFSEFMMHGPCGGKACPSTGTPAGLI